MQISIFIDSQGSILSSSNSEKGRDIPIKLMRQNKQVNITIAKNCTPNSLLSLISHLRNMKNAIIGLVSENEHISSNSYLHVKDCCLDIGQACLLLFEQEHDGLSYSHITPWALLEEDRNELPFEMLNLSKMRLGHLDTPSALSNISEAQTLNAAFYRFTSDQDLSLVKMPENMVFPDIIDEHKSKLSESIKDDVYAQWLLIAGQIAIATGMCLRQFGHLRIHSWPGTSMHPFIKLLYPIASETELPTNYRLVTITYLTVQKAYIL